MAGGNNDCATRRRFGRPGLSSIQSGRFGAGPTNGPPVMSASSWIRAERDAAFRAPTAPDRPPAKQQSNCEPRPSNRNLTLADRERWQVARPEVAQWLSVRVVRRQCPRTRSSSPWLSLPSRSKHDQRSHAASRRMDAGRSTVAGKLSGQCLHHWNAKHLACQTGKY